ncbi:(deoxy)nucleoside triphosphate pyrophosphohydrolase [bacterium]|nr:MAG: (deoxy)nucleoside triphosphate pyrophosphohydrolase [bacterium]
MKPRLEIALALIVRGDEILITKRPSTADHLPDMWEFPGGKIETGETPANAAVREAREEVGLDVEVMRALEPIEWEYTKRFVTLHPFEVRVVGGELALDGVAEAKWVAKLELNPADFPEVNLIMIDWLKASS